MANLDPERSGGKSARLHYLDWLQVLAVLGVFLFHAVHPFDDIADWHIKNEERSVLANFFVGFFALWGMPFFFMLAGAASWFSLRRRSSGLYVRERVTRLLIPFIIGALLLTPIQAYYELTHKGWWQEGSFLQFLLSAEARTFFYTEYNSLSFSPTIFGDLGYHLWFVGFLFAYALLALPLFLWLKKDSGRRFAAPFVRSATRRGGLLVFILPLIVIRFILQPFFPEYTGWSDFFFMLLFFVAGYILIADKALMQAVGRDRLLHLVLASACTLFFFSTAAGVPVSDWMASPGTPAFYFSWTAWSINSWCWAMVMLYVGSRFLDSTSNRLQYSREASYPFFMLHQPAIISIAFYAVQWESDLTLKLLVVLFGAFALALGVYELLIRRFDPVRALLGMKPRRTEQAKAKSG